MTFHGNSYYMEMTQDGDRLLMIWIKLSPIKLRWCLRVIYIAQGTQNALPQFRIHLEAIMN